MKADLSIGSVSVVDSGADELVFGISTSLNDNRPLFDGVDIDKRERRLVIGQLLRRVRRHLPVSQRDGSQDRNSGRGSGAVRQTGV